MIVITTKKGEEGRVRVNYANNTTFSSPFVMPQFQNTYGTDATAPSMSWGTKLSTPTSYDPSDFFQTGFEETNAISVSGGTRVNQSYFSAASLNSRGIIPNTVSYTHLKQPITVGEAQPSWLVGELPRASA